jgi:YesN/AraC family two-component response regulator
MDALINHFFVSLASLFQVLLFLFRPKFINRTNLEISLSDVFNKMPVDSLTDNTFEHYFFLNNYFLKKNASIEDLSNEIDASPSEISNYIYTQYSMTFTDLVNKNRVSYFISLLNSGKYDTYTVEALAELSGFGSRQNLYKSFKKHHGGTPTDLIKSVTQ